MERTAPTPPDALALEDVFVWAKRRGSTWEPRLLVSMKRGTDPATGADVIEQTSFTLTLAQLAELAENVQTTVLTLVTGHRPFAWRGSDGHRTWDRDNLNLPDGDEHA